MDETTLLKRKIMDAADKAYTQNIYTYTNFLSLSELDIYCQMAKELSFIHHESFGGSPACERQVIQFGSKEELGYEGTYPIDLLCISPLIEKFAEPLTHRDYLGALLNLGIERSLIGDIIIREHLAYVFCINHISDFLSANLTTVKHTHVTCEMSTIQLDNIAPSLQPVEIIAASLRLDAVTASLTKLSRSNVLALFREKKIFVNGRCMENNSSQLKPGDILVIRGSGKYICEGSGAKTRKDRVYVRLQKYV